MARGTRKRQEDWALDKLERIDVEKAFREQFAEYLVARGIENLCRGVAPIVAQMERDLFWLLFGSNARASALAFWLPDG